MARGEKEKISLRQTPKQYMQNVVERFNLTKWLAQEAARGQVGNGCVHRTTSHRVTR